MGRIKAVLDWLGRISDAHGAYVYLAAVLSSGSVLAVALRFVVMLTPLTPVLIFVLAVLTGCAVLLTLRDFAEKYAAKQHQRLSNLGAGGWLLGQKYDAFRRRRQHEYSLEQITVEAMVFRTRLVKEGFNVPSFPHNLMQEQIINFMASYLLGLSEYLQKGLFEEAKQFSTESARVAAGLEPPG